MVILSSILPLFIMIYISSNNIYSLLLVLKHIESLGNSVDYQLVLLESDIYFESIVLTFLSASPGNGAVVSPKHDFMSGHVSLSIILALYW